MRKRSIITAIFFAFYLHGFCGNDISKKVYVVPNFHPASCGWLTDWSTERSFCANSYIDHLNKVRDDKNYSFVISEVNNMIAIKNFRPDRFEELKKRIQEGRVEAVNAFFLEPTICLSGGEALVRQGVEGLRWQKSVLGVKPRMAWMIDETGTHEQMAQIVTGLGLDGLIQCRLSASGSSVEWFESPDGTRTLGFSTGGYSKLTPVFRTEKPLTEAQVKVEVENARARKYASKLLAADIPYLITPKGLPFLIPGGAGDYSLPPAYKGYPSEFIIQWKKEAPDLDLKFSTMSSYLDDILPAIRSGKIDLPVAKGGWQFGWHAFWIQNPTVKELFRQSEHALQAAEMLASIASLKKPYEYPSQELNHAWLLMMLNMDRNSLWGAAGGMVFEDKKSWDVKDRYDWVGKTNGHISQKAITALSGEGDKITMFNPLNWDRKDPVVLKLPGNKALKNMVCQSEDDGSFITYPYLNSVGCKSFDTDKLSEKIKNIALPETIETKYYQIQVDPKTGNLKSLKLRKSGREFLAGPTNVLIAETSKSGFGDQMPFRNERTKVASTSDQKAEIKVTKGELATVVEVVSNFYGEKPERRVMRFYNDYPRIDFDTYLEDIPDKTVVVSEFSLADEVVEVRRGIPYGFSHGWWNDKNENLHGKVDGITPAVQWSHYTLRNGGGFAIIDQGLTGREITGNKPVIFLEAAVDIYHGIPCAWLSGKGQHHFRYAIVAHDETWEEMNIPRMAWEFNSPPVLDQGTNVADATSCITTSSNLILQSVRREGTEIELRMMECLGMAGKANVKINLPHKRAEFTDMIGKNRKTLKEENGLCKFDVRPQQIITIRLAAKSSVSPVQVLTDWTPLVPKNKREALNKYYPDYKGHTGKKNNNIL